MATRWVYRASSAARRPGYQRAVCVDHPGLAIEGSKPRTKDGLRGQRREHAGKRAVPRKCVTQTGDEFSAKDLPQHLHREKEGRACVDPLRSFGRQSACGHDTVEVRMMLEALPPRVEDHEAADRGAQALRVGRDLPQRRRCGLKQQVVHDTLIGQREPGQRLRHREDEVHIADRQEFLFSRRHPHVTGGREALRTMTIATAVVRKGRLCTLIAAIAVPAECRCSALGDGAEDASMMPRHPDAVPLHEAIAVLAHDVGHLKGWPCHPWCFRRVKRAVS